MNNIYMSKPFTLQEGEEIELSPIKMPKNTKKSKETTIGVIYKDNKPVENYIIKIFKVSKAGKSLFMGFTFTDSFGQFTIPLSATGTEYVIKVFSLKEEVEDLELVLK